MKAVEFTWPDRLYRHFAQTKGIGVDHTNVKLRKRAARADTAFEMLLPHLPTNVNSIFDIGCGMAVLPVLLANHYQISNALHLLDGDGHGTQVGGYSTVPILPWNNVEVGVEVAMQNLSGQRARLIWQWQPAHVDGIESRSIDLVTSFRSWGHHYPIRTYLELVKRVLTPRGHVITDIRNGTDGLQVLTDNGFKVCTQVPDHSIKCARYVLQYEA